MLKVRKGRKKIKKISIYKEMQLKKRCLEFMDNCDWDSFIRIRVRQTAEETD